MPVPSALALESFLQDYENYKNSCQYCCDWSANVVSLATKMQIDPNFQTALDPTEQAAIALNLQAAQQMKVIPVAIAAQAPAKPIV